MKTFHECFGGDKGEPRLHAVAIKVLMMLSNHEPVQIRRGVTWDLQGNVYDLGPEETMLAGAAKQYFGLEQECCLNMCQTALANLTAESLPVHPTDAAMYLAAWTGALRVGANPGPLAVPHLASVWPAVVQLAAIKDMLKHLEAATDADSDFDTRVDLALDILWPIDNWFLACWATQATVDLGGVEAAVFAAMDEALFDHVLDYARGEVSTWQPDLATKNPELYHACRVWATLAARVENVRRTGEPFPEIAALARTRP